MQEKDNKRYKQLPIQLILFAKGSYFSDTNSLLVFCFPFYFSCFSFVMCAHSACEIKRPLVTFIMLKLS